MNEFRQIEKYAAEKTMTITANHEKSQLITLDELIHEW